MIQVGDDTVEPKTEIKLNSITKCRRRKMSLSKIRIKLKKKVRRLTFDVDGGRSNLRHLTVDIFCFFPTCTRTNLSYLPHDIAILIFYLSLPHGKAFW